MKEILVIIAVVVGIIAFIWFHATHHCVSTHVEWRQTCHETTTKDPSGYSRTTRSDCHSYPVDVCDRYERDDE